MIKVAIIGAGIAGLACLHEFERFGIEPEIFEQRAIPGEMFPFVNTTLDIFHRFDVELFDTLKRKYGIDLKPFGKMKEVLVHGPTQKILIKGDMGWYLERGQSPRSLVPCIHKQTKTQVLFNTKVNYKDIAQNYDYIVLATGNGQAAKELGLWHNTFRARIRCAVVLGKFSPVRTEMWLNTDYCDTGFTYMAPFDSNRASLVMIVPDTDFEDLNNRWQFFLDDTKIPIEIVERFDMDYETGELSSLIKDNLYFIGNAGGFVESLMGVGIFASITSGVMCAKSIVKGIDYHKAMANFRREISRSHKIRQAVNLYSNHDFDMLIRLMKIKPIQNLIYRTNFNAILAGDLLARAFMYYKKL